MKPNKPAPDSWGAFWDREARHIQKCLSKEHLGHAPLTVLCYQPVRERLVYLNQDLHTTGSSVQERNSLEPTYSDPADRILALVPDQSALKFLRDEESSTPWLSEVTTTIEEAATDVDREKRQELILNAEKQRYGEQYPYDQKSLALKPGVELRRQLVIPSPVYHHHSGWWKQIPRLGIAYTVQDMIGRDTGVPNSEIPRVADSMLFAMAIFAGNRILARRLRMIFNNSYFWKEDIRSKSVYFVENDVAHKLATGDMTVSDKSIFFVCKLILAHHLIFPHRPLALEILESLEKEGSKTVLELHGWDVPSWKISPVADLPEAIECLIVDIQFFIAALNRWEDPSDPKVQESQVTLVETLNKLVYLALGQLAGKIDANDGYVRIVPPQKLSRIRSIPVPAFTDGQIHKQEDKGDPQAFIRCLAPIFYAPEGPAWKKTTLSEISYPEGDPTQECRNEVWLAKYIYARYILARSPTKKLPGSKAPQAASN